ncbi:hypothetical protein H6G81_21995 [Scytonema hofmannii FACHB-248]|uniref:Uncharacterized protein n=1 Tax=Scytonema hofmannii FACHB-248 TaxID=1842502 RepID=A0ABR8GVN0_9CYAN|nr:MULTISPECIES: hypothetical protein [Nostocales]MBD2607126.1 hypothetical protein [Scytonema hofmannii FACHB-248]
MNSFSRVTSQAKNQDNSEVLVNVIVKQGSDGRTIAIVPGLPELQVEASDKATALSQIQQRLETHLAGAEIVSLPVKLPSLERKNPWLEMAGVFKDDPQFEQMLAAIENYRHESDKTIEDDSSQE